MIDTNSTSASIRRWIRRVVALAAGVMFVLYTVASHLAVSGHDPLWAIFPLVAGIGLVIALNAPSRAVPVLAAVIAIILAAMLRWHPMWMVYLPPTALDFVVAYLFARSLARGRTPLVEQYMRVVHPELPPGMIRHARRVNQLWVAVMASLGVIAAILALSGYGVAWSIFVNVVSYLVMAAVFVVEYLYRRAFFPPEYHTSPLGVLRVVQRTRLVHSGPGGGRPPA